MAAAQARLGHLLKKIRIDADYRTVDANLAELPSNTTMKGYAKLAKRLNFHDNLPEGWDAGEVSNEIQANGVTRMLRLSELISQFACDNLSPASLVFIMLPVPPPGGDPRAYMSLLSALSDQIKCPTIFIRGNHKDVLTLYS